MTSLNLCRLVLKMELKFVFSTTLLGLSGCLGVNASGIMILDHASFNAKDGGDMSARKYIALAEVESAASCTIFCNGLHVADELECKLI